MRLLVLLVTALCAPGLGCFDVNYGDVSFACGAGGDCPGGYECRADSMCHRIGTGGGDDDIDAGGDDIDAGGDDIDAGGDDIDAAPPPPDAGDPPANDTCAAPAALTLGVEAAGTTFGANDDHPMDAACVADGTDVVHELDLEGPAALLVTATPVGDWPMALALRPQASCGAADADVSCVASAPAPGQRYINRPTLADGLYDLVVDTAGSGGDYTVRYDVGPADATFGYWKLRTAGNTYAGITSATSIAPADETAVQVSLPFPFPFYGQTYNDVVISANGYLSFDLGAVSAADRYNNDCPFVDSLPNEMIAVFWDDLFPDSVAPAALRYKTDGVAPDRSFAVEWVNFDIFESDPCQGQCDSVNGLVAHMVVIYENGDIELRYGPRTAPTLDLQCGAQHQGCSATIGLRGGEPFDSDVSSCGTADIAEGDVIRWIHPR